MTRVYVEKNMLSENLSASAISVVLKTTIATDDFVFLAVKTQILIICCLIYSTS